MKLTVFTPLYNRAKDVEGLFRSLVAQQSYDFEWLVVDDGSVDHPDEVFAQIAVSASTGGTMVREDIKLPQMGSALRITFTEPRMIITRMTILKRFITQGS